MKFDIASGDFPVLEVFIDSVKYTICYPVPALIAAEKATGLKLKSLQHWLEVPAEHIPAILKCGFSKYHADLDAAALDALVDAIVTNMTAEDFDHLHYLLCKLAFPKAMTVIEERAAQRRGASPNAEGPQPAGANA
jgi:hypothetical protein